MAIIHSFAFQENKVSWVYGELVNQVVTIRRAEESLLPVSLNVENIQRSSSVPQVANHLKALVESHDLQVREGLFLLSGKFALVRPVTLDVHIPEKYQRHYVREELQATLSAPVKDYLIYVPDFRRERNGYLEKLGVAVPRALFEFFRNLVRDTGWQVEKISLSCFTLEELFRVNYPDVMGQSLLVNFTERGYECVLLDEKQFLGTSFRPYSRDMESIEQLEEETVLSNFDTLLEEIQRPEPLDEPRFSISQIYVFGSYFKPEWKDMLVSQTTVPIHIFQLNQGKEWQFIFEDARIGEGEAHRFIEPISHLVANGNAG